MGGLADGAALARGAAPKRRRDTDDHVYPQSSAPGDGGRRKDVVAAVTRGGGTGGIADGAALTSGADPKRRRDSDHIYPQSSVRGDGGRGNAKDVVILPDDAAVLARGEGSNRKRDGYKQPSVCGAGTGNIRDVVLPGGGLTGIVPPGRGMTGIDEDAAVLSRGGASNRKGRRGDRDYVETSDDRNTADPDLVRAALKTLPPPPEFVISLEKEDIDHDDPVYWALYWRGIKPDNKYQHYTDLYFHHQPQPKKWNEVWKSSPLNLHDAGLLSAVDLVTEWDAGMEKGILDLSNNITCILNAHPGPVSCLRIDTTQLPGPPRMQQWMAILTEKLVEELILVNIGLGMELELPLHHLRSPRLKRLWVGFARIRDCLRFAFGADGDEAHCWASLTDLNLISCGFDGSDLSYTVRDLFGLKRLTIGHSNLTVGCESKGLVLASTNLVSIHLWDCIAETAVTVGRAPALKYLTVGVKSVNAPSLLLQIDMCEDLHYLDGVDLHQQDFRLCTGFLTKIQRKNSISLPYLHTLSIAAQLARADKTMALLRLLKWLPNLTNLTVWRVDSDNGDDEVFPSLESVACLHKKLEQFTLKDFRGGKSDVTLLLSVLKVAQKLKSLMVCSHPTMLRTHTPEDVAEFFRSAPRLSQNCSIVVFAPLVE